MDGAFMELLNNLATVVTGAFTILGFAFMLPFLLIYKAFVWFISLWWLWAILFVSVVLPFVIAIAWAETRDSKKRKKGRHGENQ